MRATEKFKIHFPAKVDCSVTVYGAIGKFLRKPCFLVTDDTTNKDNTVKFLDLLVECLADKKSSITLVMDNHTAHHSHVARAALQRLKIKPLFMPAYSSDLNSIERLWSSVKSRFRKKVYQYKGELT